MKAFYFLALIALLTLSCNSVKRTQKLLLQGNYDQAISLAVKKLSKNKNAKDYDEHIRILEEAFAKATSDDLRRLNYLKKDKDPANAKKIYYTYLDLIERQNKIRPLLPLYSHEMGRQAKFDLVDYTNDLLSSKAGYLQALYQEASIYFKRNTQEDYRSAFNVLCELEEVQPNYKDVHQLKQEAHFKGTNFILVSINNQTNQMIPYRLEQDLLDFSTYGLDSFWVAYHSQRERGINYNYGLNLNFETIQIAPELISEKQYSREENIEDGYDYKRDRRGNMIKDSLGNPIKVKRYKKVTAVVTNTRQQKKVFIAANVEFLDLNRHQRMDAFPLSSEFIFENAFARYRGDERALTKEDKDLVRNRFLPFPSNEQMVFDAGMDLKLRFREILKDNAGTFVNL